LLFLYISGTVLALIGLWLTYRVKKNTHLLWAIFFLTAGTFIAWSYFNHHLECFSSAWLKLPICEAKFALSGKRIYHDTDRFGQTSGLFAISLSASLTSSPLTVYYFKLFNPGAIILNMFLVTIAMFIIINGVISLTFGLLQLTAISAFFNHGSWLLI